MAKQRNEGASESKLPLPAVIDLGEWPMAEEPIRQRALAQGMPAEEVELLLDEIRKARLQEDKLGSLLSHRGR